MVPTADFRSRSEELLKKAGELSVLCGVDVAVIIFSSTTGEIFEYSSSDMKGILTKYNEHNVSGQVPAAEIKPEEQQAAQENQALGREEEEEEEEEGSSSSSHAPLCTDDPLQTPLQTTCSFTPANIGLDDIRRMGPLGEIFLKK